MLASAAVCTEEDQLYDLQEFCRHTYHKDAEPVRSCQQLQDFYDWFVIRIGKNATGAAVVATMVYFHGYITPEEWHEGGFPDPNSHYTFKQDTMRAAQANGKQLASLCHECTV